MGCSESNKWRQKKNSLEGCGYRLTMSSVPFPVLSLGSACGSQKEREKGRESVRQGLCQHEIERDLKKRLHVRESERNVSVLGRVLVCCVCER